MCIYKPIYLALNHPHSLHPHLPQAMMYTKASLCFHLLHHDIQQDECPCTTHTCTAVYQQGLSLCDWVLFTNTTDKTNERHDIIRNSMVRPGSVVQLCNTQMLRLSFCYL